MLPENDQEIFLKWKKVKRLSLDYNVDLICLTEVNKDWRMVHQNNTIWNATQGWKQNRIIQVSYNTSEKSEVKYRVGGTAMIGYDDLLFIIGNQEVDSR